MALLHKNLFQKQLAINNRNFYEFNQTKNPIIMPTKKFSSSKMHTVPKDLKEILNTNASLMAQWQSLTPLARNEWICWVTIVKKTATRKEHLARLAIDLLKGKRRPCCWPGCPHRRLSAGKWFK